MTEEERLIVVERCLYDFPFFCENFLNVKDKDGLLVPFRLNKSQLALHDILEKQKRDKGRVRAIIVKGRQLGISTYISARYYHKILHNEGVSAFIFAHVTKASKALFDMVKLFDVAPQVPNLYPKSSTSNENEIIIAELNSQYRVGTAGSKSLGRGLTNQFVHWSEVAFCENAEEHIESIIQSVPSRDGTEILLESTADGMDNVFYEYAMSAENGESAFIPVFLPYYLDEDYTEKLPDNFKLQRDRVDKNIPSEWEYYEKFSRQGLTKEHLLWRRERIATEFAGNAERFMQEYPMDMLEAFKVSNSDAYIDPNLLHRAKDSTYQEDNRLPLIMGVDPARLGKDQFSIALRKGRVLQEIIILPKADTLESTERLIELIQHHKPNIVNIDGGNIGSGIYDNLVGRGYGNICNNILFNNKPLNKTYRDKASEMFDLMRIWLEDEPVSMASIDAKMIDRLISQICMRKVDFPQSVMGIESKTTFKNRLKYSPDEADAVMLTFATPYNDRPMTETSFDNMKPFTTNKSADIYR